MSKARARWTTLSCGTVLGHTAGWHRSETLQLKEAVLCDYTPREAEDIQRRHVGGLVRRSVGGNRVYGEKKSQSFSQVQDRWEMNNLVTAKSRV